MRKMNEEMQYKSGQETRRQNFKIKQQLETPKQQFKKNWINK